MSKRVKVIETLLQMTLDHKMHERFYTKRSFEWATQIRSQADRLKTLAERLAQVSQSTLEKAANDTLPTMEERPALTISQLELLNNRVAVPYTAILFYGHGGEPVELQEIRDMLNTMEKTLRATAQMLFGYMEKHFSTDNSLLMEPKAAWLEAAIWRSRLTTGLYCTATYYRMAAEMLKGGLGALGRAKLEGAALLAEQERCASVLLLNTAHSFLLEAARFTGMAAIELGYDEERWQHLQKALEAILAEAQAGTGGKDDGQQ